MSEVVEPISVKDSVMGSRNELGKKVRNYRHKKRKADEDDSSDIENDKPRTADGKDKAKDGIATVVDPADPNKESTCEKTR
jgi:hypothetical protein